MENLRWEDERRKREKAALEQHSRLHRLFVQDRPGFERERRKLLDDFFSSVEDDSRRKRLQALQDSWDEKMRNAGSDHDRFVLAKTLFWKHIEEKWVPALEHWEQLKKRDSVGE
ncbi:MAG: hypothetical protein V2J25_03990 [Desulfatiglans sp.]|jgi:hypothetical protein|nr:hypothetical protein [Thermodesulfobacteriota bacterium]MEE4352009.1 hypothetical protein [Desulfatiglans sp.]